jgi:hypothetical protein
MSLNLFNTVFELAIALIGTAAFSRLFAKVNALPAVAMLQSTAGDAARIGKQALPIIDTVWALYGPERYPVAQILRSAVDVLGEVSAVEKPEDFAELLSYVEREFSPVAYAEHAANTKTIPPQLFAMGKAIGEALGR